MTYREHIDADECKITPELRKQLKEGMWVRHKMYMGKHQIVKIENDMFVLEYRCSETLKERIRVDFETLMNNYYLKIRGIGGIVI